MENKNPGSSNHFEQLVAKVWWSNGYSIPYICPFWYTTILFKKYTKKCVNLEQFFFATKQRKTQCKMEVRILSGGVPKNLTLHGISKIDFQPDFRNALMLSFLLMYNTMGSKVDGLAVREHFL